MSRYDVVTKRAAEEKAAKLPPQDLLETYLYQQLWTTSRDYAEALKRRLQAILNAASSPPVEPRVTNEDVLEELCYVKKTLDDIAEKE